MLLNNQITRKQFIQAGLTGAAAALILPFFKNSGRLYAQQSKSDVYRITEVPVPQWPYSGTRWDHYHEGINGLLHLMGSNGLKIFRSHTVSALSGPSGLIGPDDVIIIKTNSQNRCRGLTNSDTVRGLVRRLLDHPDGFTGEIIIADNGHGSTHGFWSSNSNNDDAPAHDQSYRAVSLMFPTDQGYRVSFKTWTSFNAILVDDFHENDDDEGFVQFGNNGRSYAKFISFGRNTKISLHCGIWNGSEYDPEKLKIINMPVIKAHGFGSMGATICCKNYIGITTSSYSAFEWSKKEMHDEAAEGLLGDLLHCAYPVLNICDGIWCNTDTNHPDEFDHAWDNRADTLVAGIDPVACDVYCSKHILNALRPLPSKFDPDTEASGARRSLLPTYDKLIAHGYSVQWGDENINLIARSLSGAAERMRIDQMIKDFKEENALQQDVIDLIRNYMGK